MSIQKPSPLQSILAGGAAGGIESLLTYPTEYVETIQQLSAKAASPQSILISTLRNEGIRPIFTGSGIFAAANASISAVRFFTCENTFSMGQYVCGIVCWFAESATVLTPGENLKTKLIDGRRSCGISSTRQTILKVLAQDGIGGFDRGLTPVATKQCANAVVRFTSYQYLLDEIRASAGHDWWLAPAAAGGIAGIITVYATMPFDNIKTQLQAVERAYQSSFDCARGLVSQGGLRSLWKGTTPRLARLSVSGMVTFSVYERVIALINPPEYLPTEMMSKVVL